MEHIAPNLQRTQSNICRPSRVINECARSLSAIAWDVHQTACVMVMCVGAVAANIIYHSKKKNERTCQFIRTLGGSVCQDDVGLFGDCLGFTSYVCHWAFRPIDLRWLSLKRSTSEGTMSFKKCEATTTNLENSIQFCCMLMHSFAVHFLSQKWKQLFAYRHPVDWWTHRRRNQSRCGEKCAG